MGAAPSCFARYLGWKGMARLYSPAHQVRRYLVDSSHLVWHARISCLGLVLSFSSSSMSIWQAILPSWRTGSMTVEMEGVVRSVHSAQLRQRMPIRYGMRWREG